MIRWSTPKASMVGIGVFILGQMLYVGVLIKINHHEILRLVLLSTPVVAAFAAAYFAPKWKVLVGTSMAVYGAAIGVLSGFCYEFFGLYVDRIGGLLMTFGVLLAYNVVLSVAGGAIGAFLSRNPRQA